MTWYLTRVELLRDPKSLDYTQLHDRMRRAGFRTTIPANGGAKFALPPAEYFCDSTLDVNAVHQVAKDTVSSGLRFGLKCRIVVARIDAWCGSNLEAA